MAIAIVYCIILLFSAFGWNCLINAYRVPNSPYPVCTQGLNSSLHLYVYNTDSGTQDDMFTVEMLQGYLSQTSPQIYRYSVGNTAPYGLWLNLTSSLFNVNLDYTYFTNVSGLVDHYKSLYQGYYVLVDLADNSTNIAIAALSAGNPWLVVTSNNEQLATNLGLNLKYDLRGKTLPWAIQTFNNSNQYSYSSSVTVLQEASKYSCMGDFSVSMKALQWWDDNINSSIANQIWGSMLPPFATLGWGPDEFNTVTRISVEGGMMVASDWASNIDIFANYDIPRFSQAYPSPNGTVNTNVHTVCFLMSDGDNAQWILDQFATNPSWFGSPDRGYVPMGWTLSPSLADLAPVTLSYLYNQAADPTKPYPNIFVGGVSGMGYFYPDVTELNPELLSKSAALTAGYMNKADMNIVTVLSYGNGYLTNAIPEAYLQYSNINGIFWENYDDYSGMKGKISFINNKPVIGGRFNLWGDGSNPSGPTFKNVTGLIEALLSLPRDPTTENGYSLIPVHAWSHNVTDVRQVMEGLYSQAPGQIEVVSPDIFVQRIIANVQQRTEIAK